MNIRAMREVEELLRNAEEEDRCFVPEDDRLARSVQRAVARGELFSPMPGLFVRPAYWMEASPSARSLCCIRTLALAHPEWTFAGPSAALLQGLSVSNHDISKVYLAANPASFTRDTKSICRLRTASDEAEYVRGVRVTPLVQTAFDCMRRAGFRRGLAVADSVLRTRGMPRETFQVALEERFRGRKGIRAVRRIVCYADGRSANGGESMARAAMIELGYEIPELQMEVTDPIDGHQYYADYAWKLGSRDWVVGELDGHDKYVVPEMTHGRDMVEVLAGERLRESRISARHIRVMRFSFRDSQDDERFTRILDAFGIPLRTTSVLV